MKLVPILVSLLAGGLAGCTDDPARSCGDGVCSTEERAGDTCPSDCYECATPCEGDTICAWGECYPDYDLRYDFRLVGGTFPSTDADGQPWDPDGLPDPTVFLAADAIDDSVAGVWHARDTLEPTWSLVLGNVPVGPNVIFSILVYDDDGDRDQFAWSCYFPPTDPIPVDVLRSGVLVCAAEPPLDGGEMEFWIRPARP